MLSGSLKGRMAARRDVREMSSLFDKVKEFFVFKPGSTSYETYPSKAKAGQGYRYPSPGDQSVGVNVPISDDEDSVYNIQYYTRDTARNQGPLYIAPNPETRILGIPSELPPPQGSPGNKNPAVLRYDPTGTRSAMSATWDAMNAELDKNRPNHLPKSWHLWKGIDDLQWTKERNLPPRPGKPAAWAGKNYDGKW